MMIFIKRHYLLRGVFKDLLRSCPSPFFSRHIKDPEYFVKLVSLLHVRSKIFTPNIEGEKYNSNLNQLEWILRDGLHCVKPVFTLNKLTSMVDENSSCQ